MPKLVISAHTKISPEMDRKLKRLAKKRQESMSHIMRMGIEIVLRQPELIEFHKLKGG